MTFAPRLVKEMDDSMEFIITNLKNQYIIPVYSHGWCENGHNGINGIVSKFKCIVEVTNVSREEKDHCDAADIGTALADMAEIIVEDHLDDDCDLVSGFFDSATNTRLPPICFFRMDYIRTITKSVEIGGTTFEVQLTYERKYTPAN